MSTIFLLAAVLGLLYAIYWMIQNDRALTIADQRGLFRMRSSVARADDLAKAEARLRRAAPVDNGGPLRRFGKGLRKQAPQPVGQSMQPVIDQATAPAPDTGDLGPPEIVHPLVARSHRRPRLAP